MMVNLMYNILHIWTTLVISRSLFVRINLAVHFCYFHIFWNEHQIQKFIFFNFFKLTSYSTGFYLSEKGTAYLYPGWWSISAYLSWRSIYFCSCILKLASYSTVVFVQNTMVFSFKTFDPDWQSNSLNIISFHFH